MFDRIRNSLHVIQAYCDQATDADWSIMIQKIDSECEAAMLELEELEFQSSNEA